MTSYTGNTTITQETQKLTNSKQTNTRKQRRLELKWLWKDPETQGFSEMPGLGSSEQIRMLPADCTRHCFFRCFEALDISNQQVSAVVQQRPEVVEFALDPESRQSSPANTSFGRVCVQQGHSTIQLADLRRCLYLRFRQC